MIKMSDVMTATEHSVAHEVGVLSGLLEHMCTKDVPSSIAGTGKMRRGVKKPYTGDNP